MDVFRYADVAYEARRVIRRCVEREGEGEGGERYGGLVEVGVYGSFYVSVGRPVRPRGGGRGGGG